MTGALVAVLFAVGCSYKPPQSNQATDGADDSTIPPLDVGVDCSLWVVPPLEADPCAAPQPKGIALDLEGPVTLNSDTGILKGHPSLQALPYAQLGTIGVVSVASLRVRPGAVLRGEGTAPLAILVWGDAEIEGTVDISSSIAGGAGAGSDAGCADPNRGRPGSARSGGGGGGGFGANGGDGGDGAGGANGGNKGVVRPVPNKIQGGCSGGDAGGATGAGLKGAGGGALALIAMTRLRIGGVVHAGGAGGTGGVGNDNGGGGGGAGGMIKLEAADLEILGSAILAANGGQGGGGCQGGIAGNGVDGRPDALAAAQGNSDGGGTDGGGGGFLQSVTGNTAGNASKGGGGGGAGVGYIVFKGHTSFTLDPVATMSPTGDAF